MNSNSNVLIYTEKTKPNFNIEFDHVDNLASVLPSQYGVIVLETTKYNYHEVEKALGRKELEVNFTQFVLIDMGLELEELTKIVSSHKIFHIISSDELQSLESTILSAVEENALLKQNDELIKLYNEQNKKLKELSDNLEDRVLARQKSLLESKSKSIEASEKLNLLVRAFVTTMEATSIQDMETRLFQAIETPLGIEEIKISLHPPASKTKKKEKGIHIVSFNLRPEVQGSIEFKSSDTQVLDRQKAKTLTQIADATTLNIDRLIQDQETATVQKQWDMTFDAVSHPIAILKKDYTIHKSNKAFRKFNEGQKCYQVLFGHNTPCMNCQFEKSFRITAQSSHHEVISQLHDSDNQAYLHIYRDVTSEIEFKKGILKKAKEAELGTIGGSIAHELNNPLSGIITFIQLIKSDLNSESEFFEDINEMEKAALNCKDIVANLLISSRKSDQDTPQNVNISDSLSRAISLADLRSRSRGIQFSINDTKKKWMISGHSDYLIQIFLELMNSIHDLILESRVDSHKVSKVDISIHEEKKSISVLFNFPLDSKFSIEDCKKDKVLNLKNRIGKNNTSLELSRVAESKGQAKFTFPKL